MKEGNIIVSRLIPAYQNAAEAVHPAVSAFHHPTSGFEAGLPFDGLGLFPPASNVEGKAELLHGLTHLIEVVTFIQAQALGLLPGAPVCIE